MKVKIKEKGFSVRKNGFIVKSNINGLYATTQKELESYYEER